LVADRERRWRECRECLLKVILAVQHLWKKSESSRAALLTYQEFKSKSSAKLF
jgi:hypothetical protein